MAKPSVASIKEWVTIYSSDEVVIQEADGQSDFMRVRPTGGRVKYFYGETAWSDSRRFASDFDFQAWGA